ncbi:MAG TPA: hypothetical protein VLT35_07115 [Methanocella sp.]|nr:hypothetical protein [Methanocella sp.]
MIGNSICFSDCSNDALPAFLDLATFAFVAFAAFFFTFVAAASASGVAYTSSLRSPRFSILTTML